MLKSSPTITFERGAHGSRRPNQQGIRDRSDVKITLANHSVAARNLSVTTKVKSQTETMEMLLRQARRSGWQSDLLGCMVAMAIAAVLSAILVSFGR